MDNLGDGFLNNSLNRVGGGPDLLFGNPNREVSHGGAISPPVSQLGRSLVDIAN